MIDQTRPIILYSSVLGNQAPEGQCDCACVSTIPSRETSVPINWKGAYKLAESFRTFNLGSKFVVGITATKGPLVLNHAALEIAEHFRQTQSLSKWPKNWDLLWGAQAVEGTLNTLINLGILVLATNTFQVHVEESPTILSAWLHITDRCNLRCAYCYLPHKRMDMSIDTGLAAIDATIRSALKHGYRQIKIKYAGGEPLLRFSTIKKLHSYALERAKENGLGIDGVVLSNGTVLSKEIVSELRSLNLRLMVSLDGMSEAHNQQRFYANGHGTFDDAVRGIQNAQELGLLPDISVTVTGQNAAELATLVQWLLEQKLPFSFNFYRENDFSASFRELQLEEQAIIDGMLAAFKVIERLLPEYSLLAALVDRADLSMPHLRTCSVGHSYLVFDYQGRVSKCQMNMEAAVSDVHARDPLGLIRADQIGIQNVSVEEKTGCRECKWKYWCTGGCPLTTFRATGRYDVKSPNCNIYKALYPEAVRLEGLRLLKHSRAVLID